VGFDGATPTRNVDLNGAISSTTFGNGQNYSVSAWIRPTEGITQGTIIGQQYGTTFWFGTRNDGGTLKLKLSLDDTRDFVPYSDDGLTINEWQHVAFTFTSNYVGTFYINGKYSGSHVFWDGTGSFNSSELYIGWNARGGEPYPFKGDIADVAVYDKTLTHAEIATLAHDLDGDGVPDGVDDFPTDSTKVVTLPDALDIGNLQLWLDSSSTNNILFGSTPNIVTWFDHSGSQRHATQSSAGAQPEMVTSSINALNTILFDGADYLKSATVNDWKFLHDGTNNTIIAVVKTSSTNPDKFMGILNTDNTSWSNVGMNFGLDDRSSSSRNERFNRGITKGDAGEAYFSLSTADDVVDFTLTNILYSDFDLGIAGNDANLYVNGVLKAGMEPDTSPAVNTGPSTYPLTIGALGANALPFDGEIAEIMIFDKALTEAERANIHTYLADKWDLSGNVDSDGDGTADSSDVFPQDAALQTLPTTSTTLPVTSGLQLWLDGAKPHGDSGSLTNLDTLRTWVDFSGNNRHASQNVEADLPVYKTAILNSLSAINFGGSTDFLNFDGTPIGGSNFTVIALEGRTSNKIENYYMGGSDSAQNQNVILGYRADTSFTMAFFSNDFDVSVPAFGAQQFRVWTTTFGSTTGKNIYESGTFRGNDPDLNGPTSFNGGTLGKWITRNYDGDMAEFIIYNRELSAAEITDVNYYLSVKWGLQGTMDSDDDGVLDNVDIAPTDNLVHTLGTNSNTLPVTSGLKLWLDASEPFGSGSSATTGAAVQTWVDYSGNGFHASQPTTTKKPVYTTGVLNGLSALDFDGTNDFVSALNLDMTPTMTIFTVGNFTLAKFMFIEHSTDINSQDGFYFNGLGNNPFRIRNSTNVFAHTSVIDWWGTGDVLGSADYDGISGAYYRNGILGANNVASIGTDIVVTDTLFIGSRGGTSVFSDGYFYEILIYTSKLTDDERAQVNHYLSKKWGLTATVDSDNDGVVDSSDIAPTDNLVHTLGTNSNTLPVTSGLKLWLDGSQPFGSGSSAVNGSAVQTWVDYSGNGYHATQPTLSIRPAMETNTLNGLSAITFSSDYMKSYFGSSLAQPNTVFVVGKSTAPTVGHGYFIDGLTSGARHALIINSVTSQFQLYSGVSLYGTSVPNSSFNLVVGVYNSTSSEIRINGLIENTGNGGTNSIDGLIIGNRYSISATYEHPGPIAEILVYDGALSETDITKVNYYLSVKWGLQSTIDSDRDGVLDNVDINPLDPDVSAASTSTVLPVTSGLELWLDGNKPHGDGTSIGDATALQTWADLSGNGYHAINNDSGERPLFQTGVINGLSTIDFDGTDDHLTFGSSLQSLGTSGDWSIFGIVQTTTTTSGAIFGYGFGNHTHGRFQLRNDLVRLYTGPPTGGTYITTLISGTNDSQPHSVLGIYSRTNDQVEGYKDGVSDSTAVWPAPNNLESPTALNQRAIGAIVRSPASLIHQFQGHIGEVIIYNRELSDVERAEVFNYMSTKWGIEGITDSDSDGVFDIVDAFPTDNTDAVSGNYADLVMAAAPVGYWRLDETSGTVAYDSSGKGNQGTYINSPTLAQIPTIDNGLAIQLDGVNDYVSANSVTGYITNELTLELWVKPAAGGIIAAFNSGAGGNKAMIHYHAGSGNLAYFDNNVSDVLVGSYPLNQWYHIVVTIDSSYYVKYYVNGALVAEFQSGSSAMPGSGDRFSIGQEWDTDTPSEFFTGIVDEVAIYDRLLSEYEITTHAPDTDGDGVPDGRDVYPNDASKVVDLPTALTISNLQLWLDASATENLAASSDQLIRWYDFSGKANHADSAEAGSDPTIVTNQINTLTSIRFLDDHMAIADDPNIDFNADFQIMFVVKRDGNFGTFSKDALGADTLGAGNINLQPGYAQFDNNNTAFVSSPGGSMPSGEYHIVSVSLDTSENPNMEFIINEDVHTAHLATIPNDQSNPLLIGRRGIGDNLTGNFAEIIFFNKKLSVTEEDDILAYLASKWQLNARISATNTVDFGGTETINTDLDSSGDDVTVGNIDEGTLIIDNVTVTVNSITIGNEAGSTGSVTVQGSLAELLNALDLIVGVSGNAILTLEDGTVSVDGQVLLGQFAGGDGTLIINGGILRTPTMSIGLGTGKLIWYGGTINTFVIEFSIVNAGGTLSPGFSPGVTQVAGNYTQTSTGNLFMELEGTNAATPEFDQLHVSGNLTLDGTLEVVKLNTYEPALSNSFDILDWDGSLTGTFSTIKLPTLNAGLKWDLSTLYTDGVMNVVATGSVVPLDTSGLLLWLDGDDPFGANIKPYDGAFISQWADKSGSGNNVTQTATPNQPIMTLATQNGLAVMTYVDTDYFTVPNIFGSVTASEIFIVLKNAFEPPSSTTKDGLWDFGSDTQISHYPWNGNNVIYDAYGSSVRKTTVNPTQPLDVYNLYNAISASGEWTSRLNGIQLFTTATNTVSFETTSTLGKSETNIYYEGNMAEVIIYNRKLTTDEREDVNLYLAAKWGIDSLVDSDADGVPDNKDDFPVDILQVRTIPTELDLSGLVVWYNGSSTRNVGPDVSEAVTTAQVEIWYDLTGAQQHASQATTGKQPLIVKNALNSLPLLRFDGTDDTLFYNDSQHAMTDKIAIFAVAKHGSSTVKTQKHILTSKTLGSFRFGQESSGGSNFGFYGDPDGGYGAAWAIDSDGWPVDTFRVLSMNYDGANTNLYTSGTLGYTEAATGDLNDIDFSVGSHHTLNYWLDGDIAEIIVYDRSLTNDERNDIHTYLADKWGLSAALDNDGDGTPDGTDVFPYDPALQTLPTNSTVLPVTSGLITWLDGEKPHGDSGTLSDGDELLTWVDFSHHKHRIIVSIMHKIPIRICASQQPVVTIKLNRRITTNTPKIHRGLFGISSL